MKKYASMPQEGKAKSGAPYGKQHGKGTEQMFHGSAPAHHKAPSGVPSTPTSGQNYSKRNVSNVK